MGLKLMQMNNPRSMLTQRVNNALLVEKSNSVKHVLNQLLGIQAQYKIMVYSIFYLE